MVGKDVVPGCPRTRVCGCLENVSEETLDTGIKLPAQFHNLNMTGEQERGSSDVTRPWAPAPHSVELPQPRDCQVQY